MLVRIMVSSSVCARHNRRRACLPLVGPAIVSFHARNENLNPWPDLGAKPRPCMRQLHRSNASCEVAMAKYLLVSFKTCPWVQRAAIVLREKRVEFEFRHIDPDNRPDWFLAISPHKKVPVLRVDDRVSLFESNAIAEFLDETVAPRLHPEDAVERAVNRAWTDYVPTFAEVVTATAYADTEADYNKAAEKIPGPFERLQKALAKQGRGPHFNGAQYSLVDAAYA